MSGVVAEDGRLKTGGSRGWRQLRQAVQVLTLLLFLYLLLETRQEGATFLPYALFFHLDPLAGISTMLAGRRWVMPLALGGATLLLALLVGRAWCGWLCPLGTLLDWTPAHRLNQNGDIPSLWRQVKYWVLFTILLTALLGSLTLLVLDPITLLFRTIAGALLPAFSLIITVSETWLYRIGPLQPAVDWFDGLVRSSLLTEQPFFIPNLLLVAVLAGILALNAIRPRFWCRYFCPLGGLLGLVSKLAQVRHTVDEAKCNACQRCVTLCPAGAVDQERGFAADSAECTACLDCVEICPTQAITFRGQWGLAAPQRYDPSRRQFLASLAVGAVGATLLRTIPILHRTRQQDIRPPGTSEEQLQSRCIRCGECIRVCPTGGLQPTLSAPAWDRLWTPALVSRHGYCDYSCNSCGRVCPTGAISELPLAEKRETVIGIAAIDEKRCIPFAEGRDCIVCEEMCPVPQKAVVLEERTVVTLTGETVAVRCPRVVRDLCIGCGICEYQCPLNGEAAIRVYPQ